MRWFSFTLDERARKQEGEREGGSERKKERVHRKKNIPSPVVLSSCLCHILHIVTHYCIYSYFSILFYIVYNCFSTKYFIVSISAYLNVLATMIT